MEVDFFLQSWDEVIKICFKKSCLDCAVNIMPLGMMMNDTYIFNRLLQTIISFFLMLLTADNFFIFISQPSAFPFISISAQLLRLFSLLTCVIKLGMEIFLWIFFSFQMSCFISALCFYTPDHVTLFFCAGIAHVIAPSRKI